MYFKMRCPEGHEWVETYPVNHTLFGCCPACSGNPKNGRVQYAIVNEGEK